MVFQLSPSVNRASGNKILHLDGLRGLAILMVLLFHCFDFFPNGFLGVDIFLVLSGYLLFRRFWTADTGFGFRDFLVKKICRLFPLAATIAFVCCLLAPALLPREIVVSTAKTALASLVGASNLYLDYSSSDYFSSGAKLNPLVHTWYLSVIAQVYLLFAVLASLCRFASRRLKVCLVSGISILSVVVFTSPVWVNLCIPLTTPTSVYYWTSARLWMIGAGALAHFLPHEKMPKVVGVTALLILIGFGFSPLPLSFTVTRLAEILTVLCSCAVIVGGGKTPSALLLNRGLLSSLGKYSFSLYIVHWPVIVFSSYAASICFAEGKLWVSVAVAIVSVPLAVGLYHLVEKRKISGMCTAAAFAVVAAMAAVLVGTEGLKEYIYPRVNAVEVERYGEHEDCRPVTKGRLYDSLPAFRQETHHGGFGPMQYWGERIPLLYAIGKQDKEPDFLLLGDSHAESLYPGFDVLAREQGWNGAYLHTYVIPLENVYAEFRPYQRWDREKAAELLSYLERNPGIRTVFVANFWRDRFYSVYCDWNGKLMAASADEERNYTTLYAFLKRIQQLGKHIVVFSDVPQMPETGLQNYIQGQLMYGQALDESKLTCTRARYDRDNQVINALLDKWAREGLCTVLHPEEGLLRSGACRCFQDGILYYKDGHHLSLPGSIKCMRALETELKEILDDGAAGK